MSGERSREDHIVASWHRNAAPWTEAVRGCAIESRRLVTDRAIIDAVLDRNPSRVLDIGCGEGWLARRLGELGLEVTGIDVVPELIQRARERGGTYVVASYEEVARGVPSQITDDLLSETITLDHDELRERMSGNLCRCGAHNGIVAAIAETYMLEVV